MKEYFIEKYFIRRILLHLILKAMIFFPVITLTSFINIEMAKIIGYNTFELFPLAVVLLYLLPFPIIGIEVWGYLFEGNRIDVETRVIMISIILFMIIGHTITEIIIQKLSLDNSSLHLQKENRNGKRPNTFNLLIKNMVKFLFIVIFPPILLTDLHNRLAGIEIVGVRNKGGVGLK